MREGFKMAMVKVEDGQSREHDNRMGVVPGYGDH
jgi:hypothetical protein